MMKSAFSRKAVVKTAGLLAILLTIGLVPAGCNNPTETDKEAEGGGRKNAIEIAADTWYSGSLASPDDEKWYKFTATAAAQYIHFNSISSNTIYVQLYDSNGSKVGNSDSSNWSSNIYRTVTVGQTYYIEVTSGGTGATSFKIAFNTMDITPGAFSSAASLAADTWSTGNLASASEEKWYKFTATATTQYIHFTSISSNTIYVQLYDSNGSKVGNSDSSNWSSNIYRTVTVGQTYYIEVTSGGTGATSFKIAFNTSDSAPSP